jgi:L-threonylcarbamoyladenylate synthase
MERLSLIYAKLATIVHRTIKVLDGGGVVVFPSDTVYGLAVDPANHRAIEKLLALKSRQIDKAVSVAVADEIMARKYVVLNQAAKQFIRNFLPGPFTLVAKVRQPARLDPLVYSTKGTLGIRIPDHPLINSIVKSLGRPITATSANISGQSPHYSVSSFLKTLSAKRKALIDLVIDAGQLPYHLPSTVIDFSQEDVKQWRAGDYQFGRQTRHVSSSEKQTKELGRKLIGQYYSQIPIRPLIICLVGELGSGKTTLTQGIGSFFGLSRINSPTFNIVKEYPIDQSIFYHLDTYRLDRPEELEELEFGRMVADHNLVVVEWAERVKKIIQKQQAQIIWVFMETTSANKRTIRVFTDQ